MTRIFLLILICVLPAVSKAGEGTGEAHSNAATTLQALLDNSVRVPNSSGWFEILKLPNNVYALWEPGHAEKVNSFFIPGDTQDLLYDTGMGIANIRMAIAELRRAEGLPERAIMVVNSHNHLDHNGGNGAFEKVWTVNEPWALRRLSLGVPAGEAGGFLAYWNDLTDHPGVHPPAGFDPAKHAIPPYPLEQVGFLEDNQSISLGDRELRVIRTFSHSPDGIALYDARNGLFFGGDAFYGAEYLVTDLTLLAQDLERVRTLPVQWHYASHGAQLITAMQHGTHLLAVVRMLEGEGSDGSTTFAGRELPLKSLEGVTVILAKDLLLY